MLLKTWTANRRSIEHYSKLNAAEQWKPLLSEMGWKTWRACFGPWIGSDWTNVSLHHVGQFLRKQLITRPADHHAADSEGPAWMHGAGDGWLPLRGPSSECWIDEMGDDAEHSASSAYASEARAKSCSRRRPYQDSSGRVEHRRRCRKWPARSASHRTRHQSDSSV